MLIKFLKIVVAIFISFLFIILLLITFNSQKKENNIINFDEYKLQNSVITKINNFDTIYSKDTFKVKKKGDNVDIKLDKGTFIMNLNDLSKKYIISGSGFFIDLKIPGDIYISTKKQNNIILSLNSIIKINFLDLKNNIINSIQIYPHEYFIFNPKLNKISFKKADIYRLRMLNIVKNHHIPTYVKQSLNNIQDKNISNIIEQEDFKLLNSFIKDKKELLKINKINYNKIVKTNIIEFPLSDLLKQHKKYFLNDQKKIIFLKNEIYNKLILLFKKHNFSKKEIQNILILKNELKNISQNAYQEIENFIDNIYYILLLDNDITDYKKLENFLYLKEGKTNNFINSNFLNLKRIYINYDYYKAENTKQFFKKFLDTYLQKSGIIEKNNNFILNKKSNTKEVESFLFYLKEYVYAHLYNNINIELDNQILSKYFSLNKMIYFSNNKDNIKIKTSLVKNKKILEKISNFLKINFFETQRENNILILKQSNKYIDLEQILILEKQINHIIEIFKNYKILLKQEEINEFNDLFKKIQEYFYALKDYNNYYIEKNKEVQKLLNIKGLSEKSKKIYTIKDIKEYFSYFNGINTNNIQKKENNFNINNIYIYNKQYNFKLYPYNGFKLDVFNAKNIYLFSFNLKEQKKLWEKMYKQASQDKKYKYDFKNFFIQKFKNNNNYTKNTNIKQICISQNKIYDTLNNKCIEKIKDSPLIRSFKQNKLLIDEFSITKNFFNIKYDNLFVKQKPNGGFEIKLRNVETIIELRKNGDFMKYKIFLDADYDLAKHSLSNISFSIKNKNGYLFENKKIELSKFRKVKLLELNKFLENFLKENISLYKSIFNTIRTQYILYNFRIKNVFGITTFYSTINSKNIEIKFDKSNIISIIVEQKELLKNNINFAGLKDYINKF